MSEDPTRATARGPETPAHGNVGTPDPHADPATTPGLRAPRPGKGVAVPEPPTVPTPGGSDPGEAPTVVTPRPDPVVTHTRTGGLWTGLIGSAVVLIVLLVFILQNPDDITIRFFGLSGALPGGVALLLAAVAGLLLVAIPGGLRIMQLRRIARRAARDR